MGNKYVLTKEMKDLKKNSPEAAKRIVEEENKFVLTKAGVSPKLNETRQKLSELISNPVQTETLAEFRKRNGIAKYDPNASYNDQKGELAKLLETRKADIYKSTNASLAARGLSRSSVSSSALAGANAQLAGEEARANLALLRQRELGREKLYSTNLNASFQLGQLGISQQNADLAVLQTQINDANEQTGFGLQQQKIEASKRPLWAEIGGLAAETIKAGAELWSAAK